MFFPPNYKVQVTNVGSLIFRGSGYTPGQ